MEMQTYIGVKQIKAKPMNRQEYNDYRGWELPEDENGSDEGYLVESINDPSNHPNHKGYISWSPREVFEPANFPIKEVSRISVEDVDSFLGVPEKVSKIDSKTTLVSFETVTGFVTHETSSCVDPDNYDERIGVECATNDARDKIWTCLGFVLQWAKDGLGK